MQSFEKYGLNKKLLKSIKELGFKKPTSIQDKVIPHILSSESDIIATAQTGTGKTAAFGLPIINLTDNHNKNIECVILCPTRELCIQISKDLSIFSKHMKYYKIIPIYGGSKIETQIKSIREKPKIVVCTPGRLNDLIQRKKINLSLVKYFVLDEADEMLSMGFKAEIDKVLNEVPEYRKIYLFSATLSVKVKKITEMYMKNPLTISASPVNLGAETVKHVYYILEKNKRYNVIKNIIDINKDIYTIIFCRTRRETKVILSKLINDRYNAKVLNGDLSQNERDNVMSLFREKKINILVATDVASRGIDVNNLTHIINYNLPDDPEVYIHRSGRTGRAGNEGLSIVFISRNEFQRLDEIKRLSKISFEKSNLPSQSEVFKAKISSFSTKVVNASVPSKKDRVLFEDFYSDLEVFTKEEIIGKMLTLNIKGDNKVKDTTSTKIEQSNEGKIRNNNNSMSKLVINIGRTNKLTPEILIRLINKTIRSRNTEIGKINISKNYSTFEIENKMKNIVISKMQHIRHNRMKVLVSNYNFEDTSLPESRRKKGKRKRRK